MVNFVMDFLNEWVVDFELFLAFIKGSIPFCKAASFFICSAGFLYHDTHMCCALLCARVHVLGNRNMLILCGTNCDRHVDKLFTFEFCFMDVCTCCNKIQHSTLLCQNECESVV